MVHRSSKVVAWCAIGAALLASGLARSEARIDWDDNGVPHVLSADDISGFKAFGWAQMHAHANRVLRLYAAGRGITAERLGEPGLESDMMARHLQFPSRAQQWLAAMPASERERLAAFVAGMNAYAKTHPKAIDAELRGLLPVKLTDPLAHTQRVMHEKFRSIYAYYALQRLKRASAAPPPAMGSNAWAIAPARSASGNAMLLINPHIPWGESFAPLFEVHLRMPSMQIYGVAPLGAPYVTIGFNETAGWTHTVNQSDGADLYELTLRGEGYVLDGAERPFTRRAETVRVKRADGSLEPRQVEFRSSVHGPVVAQVNGKAYALRISALENFGFYRQYWDMASAPDLDRFESTLARLEIPFLNVVYAGRAGHIFYLYGGAIPNRSRGDHEFWSGIVPGDRSSLVWSSTLPWAALPKFRDPPAGFIQNANDLPWTTTSPAVLAPQSFSPLVAPREAPLSFRPQHSIAMITSKEKMSLDDLVLMQTSTRLTAADHMLDDLLAAGAAETDPQVKAALQVLAAWDRTSNADSRGAVLFINWARRLFRSGTRTFAELWNPADPLATPRGLANPTAALAALKAAATEIETQHGALDVPYGKVYRLPDGEGDMPASGGPPELGSFRAAEEVPQQDGTMRIVSGDTFVAAVEFGPRMRAQALMTHGNSTQPGLPGVSSQLRLFADRKLRDVLYYPEDIARHVALAETVR